MNDSKSPAAKASANVGEKSSMSGPIAQNATENTLASLPETDMPIDPGIAYAVAAMRDGGIDTFESCQGGEGHAMPEPTIRFHGNAWEGHRAFAVAMERGLPVHAVKRSYSVVDGQLEGPWWEMTFRTTDQPVIA